MHNLETRQAVCYFDILVHIPPPEAKFPLHLCFLFVIKPPKLSVFFFPDEFGLPHPVTV